MGIEHRLGRAFQISFLLIAGGCVGPPGADRGWALEASPHPYEADIPLPKGFRLADRSCEDWAAGPVRYVRHSYRGRADKYAVRRFYREQMPLVKWTAVSDGSVAGGCTMRFERGAESCTVSIKDDTPGWSGHVIIEVIIAPIVE